MNFIRSLSIHAVLSTASIFVAPYAALYANNNVVYDIAFIIEQIEESLPVAPPQPIVEPREERFGDSLQEPAIENLSDSAPAELNELPTTRLPPPPEKEFVPVKRPVSQEELSKMSSEELFRLAFGRAAPERPRNLTLNVIADGWSLGDAEIVYEDDHASFKFISPKLSEYLDSTFLSDKRFVAGDSVGYFYSPTLRAAGFIVDADEQAYELRVTLPPDSKKISKLNLKGGYVWRPTGEFVKPAAFSFYINYMLFETYSFSRINYRALGSSFSTDILTRVPLTVNFSGAAAMRKWVLESSASVSEPPAGQMLTWDRLRRGDARLIRDFVYQHGKLTIGDVAMPLGGGTVGGARYEYNKSLFGNAPQDEESRVVFFMPKPGYVEVFINDMFNQTFFLPAGMHEVRGFDGAIGRNGVRLVLRMEDGSIEEVPFEFILGSPRNIGLGESRVAATVGARRESAAFPATFRYIAEDPAISVDYLYGLTRAVSAGLGGIVTRYNNVARAQILWNLENLGFLSIQGIANYALDSDTPIGEYMDISYSPNTQLTIKKLNRMITNGINGGPLPQIGLSIRGFYRSEYFNQSPFYQLIYKNSVMGGVSGSIGWGVLRGGISFSADMNFNRKTETNIANYTMIDYNYGARLSQSIFNVPVSVSAGVNVTGGVTRPYASINMSHGFGVGAGVSRSVGGHEFTAAANINTGMTYTPVVVKEVAEPIEEQPQYEIVSDEKVDMDMGGEVEFGWRWANGKSTNGSGAQSYAASVSVPDIFDPNIPGFRANMRHTYNRAAFDANYNYSSTNQTWNMETHNVSATLSGSLMYADNLWAMGRQVQGGFVLIDARDNLKGASIHIDRLRNYGQDFSKNGWLGAAYRNNITAYFPTQFTLTLTDAPPDAVLQNNRYYAEGGNQQGYALKLGDKEGVMMSVRVSLGGVPLSYTYVTIAQEDVKSGKTKEERATFTGADGVLQMADLIPGATYRIKFGAIAGIRDVLVEIPKNAGAIFEAADIHAVSDDE